MIYLILPKHIYTHTQSWNLERNEELTSKNRLNTTLWRILEAQILQTQFNKGQVIERKVGKQREIFWSPTPHSAGVCCPALPDSRGNSSLFLNFIYFYFWLCWVFLSACGLSLAAASGGSSLVVLHGLLIAVTSLAVKHGLQAHGHQQLRRTGLAVVAPRPQSTGLAVVHRLICPGACGILPDQRRS